MVRPYAKQLGSDMERKSLPCESLHGFQDLRWRFGGGTVLFIDHISVHACISRSPYANLTMPLARLQLSANQLNWK
jgi:hypothetical protein